MSAESGRLSSSGRGRRRHRLALALTSAFALLPAVVLALPAGAPATLAADHLTYVALPPTVTGISPDKGPTTGGTVVTITGAHLAEAAAVRFGTAAATIKSINKAGTAIKATAPAHAAATLDVTVTAPGGASATTGADRYTYVPAPVVMGISPASGPSAGGAEVTITGFNLNGATVVTPLNLAVARLVEAQTNAGEFERIPGLTVVPL